MKVSVLMPVHNAERTLQESVDSILQQSYAEFEFIVVDDGSTDRTPALLDAIRDERIVRLRNESNLGLIPSLNRGLAAARGEYVARLDGDDLAYPDRLALQVAALDADPELTALGTWTTLIDESGETIGTLELGPGPGVIAWQMVWLCAVVHSSVMMRRSTILALGGYDPGLEFIHAEDYDLWTRVVQSGGKIAILPRHLTRYRCSSHQISVVRAAEQQARAVEVSRRYVNWLLGRPVDPELVRGMYRLYRGEGLTERVPRLAALSLAWQVQRRCQQRTGSAEARRIAEDSYHLLTERARQIGIRAPLFTAALLLLAAVNRPGRALRGILSPRRARRIFRRRIGQPAARST